MVQLKSFAAAVRAFALVISSLAVALSGCAGSSVSPESAAVPVIGNPDPGMCPVMDDHEVDVEKAMATPSLHADYQGKRYLFCCKQCKPEFLKDPAKYTQPQPGA